MQPLKAGSGLFGTGLIDLEDLKRSKLNISSQQKLTSNRQMLECMRTDGIYVEDSDVIQKFTDINT